MLSYKGKFCGVKIKKYDGGGGIAFAVASRMGTQFSIENLNKTTLDVLTSGQFRLMK